MIIPESTTDLPGSLWKGFVYGISVEHGIIIIIIKSYMNDII